MNDVTLRRVEDLEYYAGPKAIPGIRFRPAAKALGVTAWGMNVLDLDAGCTGYPEHDHARDGQEEVYVLLRGTATLVCGEDRFALEPGVLVRVPPERRRKILPGPQGATVLALGGTPGKAYEPRR